jgi:hypothetical protein
MESISTGLVETFLMYHSERFADRMVEAAKRSDKMRDALAGAATWYGTPKIVRHKVRVVLYGPGSRL